MHRAGCRQYESIGSNHCKVLAGGFRMGPSQIVTTLFHTAASSHDAPRITESSFGRDHLVCMMLGFGAGSLAARAVAFSGLGCALLLQGLGNHCRYLTAKCPSSPELKSHVCILGLLEPPDY